MKEHEGRLLLAIETSQARGGVALGFVNDPFAVAVEMLAPASRHDDDLLPAIDRLMKRAGAKPPDLAAVAVSIGPGGFTGLRIAVATAKALAEALHVRLVAVPSALVAAETVARALNGPLLIALACKKEALWLTRLERSDGEWRLAGLPGSIEASTFDPGDARSIIADEHLPAIARRRCEEHHVTIIAPGFDAAACWRVGARMLESGNVVRAIDLLPLYAREPEAVALWRTRASSRAT